MNKKYWIDLGRSVANSRTLPSAHSPKGGWQKQAFEFGYLLGGQDLNKRIKS